MKRLLLILMMVFLISTVQSAPLDSSFLFVNYQIDDADLSAINYGVGLPGEDFIIFTHTTVGEQSEVEVDIGYYLKKSQLSLILITGAGSDWTTINDDPVTYLIGATGVVLTYAFNDEFGLQFWSKYKYNFDAFDAYQDGYIYGAGLFFGL